MADLPFLQAVRDTIARSTGALPVPQVMQSLGLADSPTVNAASQMFGHGGSGGGGGGGAPSGMLPPQAQQALNAGDALFQRLGPQFDPLVSGMHRAFGYAAQQDQPNPAQSGDPSVHYWQRVPNGS